MISKENNESAALVAQGASRVFPTELFLHIMEILRDYCDDETLETLASTCTEFEELALKFQHHGLDTRHFGAAFQPVRSNLGRRFQDWTEHLREIIVQPCRNVLFLWFLDKEDSKELLDFIRKCTSLTKVTVFVEGGAIPEFWDWVASCQTLRALELVPGGGDGMTLPMTGIKFPPGLRRLHIDFRDEHEKERDCLFTEAANDAFLNKIAKAPLIESFSIEGGRAVGFKPERNKAALAKLMHLETYYLGAIEPLLQVPEFRPKSLTLTNDSFKEPLTVDQLRQIWPKIAALDSLEKLEVSAGLADPVLEKLPTNVRRLLLQGLLTNFSNYDQEKVKKVLKVGTKEFVKVSVRVAVGWRKRRGKERRRAADRVLEIDSGHHVEVPDQSVVVVEHRTKDCGTVGTDSGAVAVWDRYQGLVKGPRGNFLTLAVRPAQISLWLLLRMRSDDSGSDRGDARASSGDASSTKPNHDASKSPKMASETPSQSEKITLTVRIIKSFEYRTTKNIVLHGTRHASATDPDHPNPDFSLDTTNVADLKEICKKKIATTPGFKPFLNTTLDCMKLYFFAHGQKTSNLIINVDKDEVYMDDNLTLAALNIDDETEISFFEKAGYEAYKSHPDTKW